MITSAVLLFLIRVWANNDTRSVVHSLWLAHSTPQAFYSFLVLIAGTTLTATGTSLDTSSVTTSPADGSTYRVSNKDTDSRTTANSDDGTVSHTCLSDVLNSLNGKMHFYLYLFPQIVTVHLRVFPFYPAMWKIRMWRERLYLMHIRQLQYHKNNNIIHTSVAPLISEFLLPHSLYPKPFSSLAVRTTLWLSDR